MLAIYYDTTFLDNDNIINNNMKQFSNNFLNNLDSGMETELQYQGVQQSTWPQFKYCENQGVLKELQKNSQVLED